MANKKVIFSVTAGAFIASSIFMAEDAEAASYKVKSGDSLWNIAQKYQTTVSNLKSLNDLSGNIIHPNQVIETSKKASSSKSDASKTDKQTSTKTSTYSVKSGDTLSGIASKNNISLKDLMKWNNLDTTLIFPGNKLIVSKSESSSGKTNSGSSSSSSSSSKSSSSSTSDSSSNSSKASVYTVKSGDTLSRIAAKHKGVSVQNLKKWNNLKSDLIVIGQKIQLSKDTTKTPDTDKSSSAKGDTAPAPSDVDYNVDKLMSTATSTLGTSYVWGGSTLSGFDCSGFIHYAYNQAGKDIARLSSDGYHSRAYYVDTPKIGDLVFFEGTYRAGISHLGIYVGNNEFIHAGSNGVEKSNLNNSYWKKHFEGFKRFY